ncbi:PqqD family peptide modification chaperone [Kitasatospora sp. NBC_01266]|uniref:PqqD family peptide modification chaperone n=1 Tax=Kitasatospora sp. NBC_01266 TaxID=2903572 RepID=UPI002E307060|nr:PqqD family peptide modification chaperone [Kitasatospora sp. NBC_01266]
MRVLPVPGLSVSVDMNGRLNVVTETLPSSCFQWGPVGTAIWIALRQHDGDLDAAARTLAAVWETELVNTRADLEIWVEELRDAGLVRSEPSVPAEPSAP